MALFVLPLVRSLSSHAVTQGFWLLSSWCFSHANSCWEQRCISVFNKLDIYVN